MIDSNSLQTNYSANIRLQLLVGDQIFPLAKIGPESIVLREAIELPACEAEISMSVDGREHRWQVFLTDGAVPFDTAIQIMSR